MVAALVSDGHPVPTAHLAESGTEEKEAVLRPDECIPHDVDWIWASDGLIAEVSIPSHGVGMKLVSHWSRVAKCRG